MVVSVAGLVFSKLVVSVVCLVNSKISVHVAR